MDLASFLMDFGVAFCSNICRPPKPPSTKRTDGKQQKQADNCRNMQKSNANNNADIKTSIENLQLAERNQLQQTPSYKIGGGGARAARRTQIRRICRIRFRSSTRLATPLCETGAADPNAPSGASTAAPYFVDRRLLQLIVLCRL